MCRNRVEFIFLLNSVFILFFFTVSISFTECAFFSVFFLVSGIVFGWRYAFSIYCEGVRIERTEVDFFRKRERVGFIGVWEG